MDLAVTRADASELAQFKEEMMDKFKMSDLGILSYYLEIEVDQSGSVITLP